MSNVNMVKLISDKFIIKHKNKQLTMDMSEHVQELIESDNVHHLHQQVVDINVLVQFSNLKLTLRDIENAVDVMQQVKTHNLTSLIMNSATPRELEEECVSMSTKYCTNSVMFNVLNDMWTNSISLFYLNRILVFK